MTGPANTYPLRDAQGNPVTVEFEDGRRAIDVQDIPIRRLVEEGILLLTEIRDLLKEIRDRE